MACTPAFAELKTLQNDSFTGTATFAQLASFADLEIGAAVFTAEAGDYPFRIETDLGEAALFTDSFERGDQSCWQDPAP